MPSFETTALLAFAAAFLVVGIFRITEFKGVGLSHGQRVLFTITHILGCVLFSIALGLLAIDVSRIHRTLMTVVFFSALGLLFPLHIYVALKRRIRLKDMANSPKI